MKPVYRYERKFVITSYQYVYLINQIETHGWDMLFPKRRINNIYLDTIKRHSYHQSLEGDLKKEKYRIRWYGHTFPSDKVISNPVFEIKVKTNTVNYKILNPLKAIQLYNGMPYTNLKKQVFSQLSKRLSEYESIKLFNKEIQFINNYDREYFINSDSAVRLTIDKNQNYFQIAPNIKHYATDDSIVVELKYNLDKDYKNFFIRKNLSQNSKYRNGVDLLFGI